MAEPRVRTNGCIDRDMRGGEPAGPALRACRPARDRSTIIERPTHSRPEGPNA